MGGNDVFDLLGIGFGPSGIALACAMEDAVERDGSNGIGRVRFLERSADATWQGGLLLRETDIQHHFLRDLATPRNPRSRFTFANYLKEKGRIFDFGELVYGAAGGAVGRLEWSDYLRWAAGLLSGYVGYGEEITSVEPVAEDGVVAALRVSTRDATYVTRRLVCSCGRGPFVPEPFRETLGPRVFHSTGFLDAVKDLDPASPLRFAVVGSGQSAAEILLHLHQSFPRSTLTSIHRSVGFQLVDLCQFSNEVFHPEGTERFFGLPAGEKAAALKEIWRTNYGTIDQQVSDALYRRIYEDKVLGKDRIRNLTRCGVTGIDRAGDGFRLHLAHRHTGDTSAVDADVIVLCTGQQEMTFPAFLSSLRELIETDPDGAPLVTRDYRVATTERLKVPIYFSGLCERTHGIAEGTSFSGIALRAERIYESLTAG